MFHSYFTSSLPLHTTRPLVKVGECGIVYHAKERVAFRIKVYYYHYNYYSLLFTTYNRLSNFY